MLILEMLVGYAKLGWQRPDSSSYLPQRHKIDIDLSKKANKCITQDVKLFF